MKSVGFKNNWIWYCSFILTDMIQDIFVSNELSKREYLQEQQRPHNMVSMAWTSIGIVLELFWWSSWFVPEFYISSTRYICLESHPFLHRYSRQYSLENFRLITVSPDPSAYKYRNFRPIAGSPDTLALIYYDFFPITASLNLSPSIYHVFFSNCCITRPLCIKIPQFSPNNSITWYLGIDIPQV